MEDSEWINLSQCVKRSFFQATLESVRGYGCEPWTLKEKETLLSGLMQVSNALLSQKNRLKRALST